MGRRRALTAPVAPTAAPVSPRDPPAASQSDLERDRGAVAQHLDVDRVARRELRQGRIERMLLIEHLVVDADDDVAILDAAEVGGLAGLDAGDGRAAGF